MLLAAAPSVTSLGVMPTSAGDGAAAAIASRPGLQIAPTESLFDSPLRAVVSQLKPRQRVTLRVSSTDGAGVEWRSSSVFVANREGVVDVAHAPAVAGGYTGIDPMGPFEMLAPTSTSRLGLYDWFASTGSSRRLFTVTASVNGRAVASGRVYRSASVTGETFSTRTLAADGFDGISILPPADGRRHPAVLIFGGSEGGIHSGNPASLLAAHGYPTLALAYFGSPGLPTALANIPLEYFARALTWLAAQPNVDPGRIFVSGGSRGSAAALLLAVYFPSLVHAVIVGSPDSVVWSCCSPTSTQPPFTLNGNPLPYSNQFPNLSPTDDPAAVIPAARIRAPILLVCGGADQLKNSCSNAQAIVGRLPTTTPRLLLGYPSAGHGIDTYIPYEPTVPGFPTAGATPHADQLAHARLWPRVLAFLRAYSSR